MSLDVPLQVAIALAFIYAMTSLLASAVQELFASYMKLRAKNLAEGLRQILSHDPSPAPNSIAGPELFDAVMAHPLVHGGSTGKMPSYASSRNLALALLDKLKGTSPDLVFADIRAQVALLPDGAAKTSLLALVADARNDVDLLQKRLETWFDDAMERMSGAYKRWTQVTTLLIGLAAAMALNIDTIHIVQTLWSDPTQRASATATVEAYLRDHPPSSLISASPPAPVVKTADTKLNGSEPRSTAPPPETASANAGKEAVKPNDASAGPEHLTGDEVKRRVSQLTDLPLPIGAPWPTTGLDLFMAVVGWLLTAVAVSLGAPFWFDTLQRLANLRGAGPKPKRAGKG